MVVIIYDNSPIVTAHVLIRPFARDTVVLEAWQLRLQVIDVDVIVENCPMTIPLRYILTSSDYGVYNSHYILYNVTFVTAGVRDKPAINSGSDIYMGLWG